MIENFKHRALKKLYEKGDRSGLRTDIAEKAELYLSILDTAKTVQELIITGFGSLETSKGFTVLSVSRNHRMIFRFEGGNAFDVDLMDYH